MARVFDTPLFTTDQSIDRVLAAGLPVALVFVNGIAPSALAQMMGRLAEENAGKLLVVQTSVKDSPHAASRFAIRVSPALVTFRDGKEYSRAENISINDLEQHVNYLLGKGSRPVQQQSRQNHSMPGSWRSADHSAASGTQAKPYTVTDTSFDQEVLRSEQPVLVDFWAPWCGPCRITEPVIQKLAQEFAGRIKVAKVNVDENPMSSGRFGVRAVPTMMLVKGGRVVDRWSGALPEAALRSRIANHI